MSDPPFPFASGDDMRTRMYEQMLQRRTVFLDRELSAETASLAAAQLLALEADSRVANKVDDPVTLIVNSPGGPLAAVAALLDTIDTLGCPVDTVCLGVAVGTAVVVVASGTGRRRSGPSAQFRLRLPDVELSGDARRIEDAVAQHRGLHDMILDRLATATGQDRRLIERDVERGRALTAVEARQYGLVDELAGRA